MTYRGFVERRGEYLDPCAPGARIALATRVVQMVRVVDRDAHDIETRGEAHIPQRFMRRVRRVAEGANERVAALNFEQASSVRRGQIVSVNAPREVRMVDERDAAGADDLAHAMRQRFGGSGEF